MTNIERFVACCLIVAAGLVAWGAWLAWPPAGYVVGGVELAALAVLLGLQVGKPDRS